MTPDTLQPAPPRGASVTRLTAPPMREPVGVAPVQGTLALDLGCYGMPSPPPALSLVPDNPSAELRRWATGLAQALVEVTTGHRPPTQLVRWTTRSVYADVARRALLHQQAVAAGRMRAERRPQVCSVRVSHPREDCAEVSVHVRHEHRSRALAARLERRQGRWQATAVEFG